MNKLKSNIIFSENPVSELSAYICSKRFSSVFILTDENTKVHCFPLLAKAIVGEKVYHLQIKSGENNKDLKSVRKIWSFFFKKNADRNSLLINVGGGLLCDIGGFAAGTYKRGISYINIPTTLLAMADAASGGKTGFNFNGLKNEIGIFYNASLTLIYPPFIQTQDKIQILSGYAEMLKHGLIADKKHWDSLNKINPMHAGHLVKIYPHIKTTVFIKNSIVSKDPLEKNFRKSLNFGHTIGHALESFLNSGNKPVPHGIAVGWGMMAETFLSYQKNYLTKKEYLQIKENLILKFGQPDILESDFDALLGYMKRDKKNLKTKINFSLLEKTGKCKINVLCSEEEIRKAVNEIIPKRD